MNLLRKFLGSSPTGEVASIPSGKLFLTRSPLSPKGEFECLYNDAYASIRQTTTPFYYQLCITRVYQEGEDIAGDNYEDSDDDDGFNSSDSAKNTSLGGHSKDEWSFAIMEDLQLRRYEKPDSSRVIAWKDINGDVDDMFEFVIDEDCKTQEIDSFMLALYKCVFELKYRISSENIKSMDQLAEFIKTLPVHSTDHGLSELKNHQITSNPDTESESESDGKEQVAPVAPAPKGNIIFTTSLVELHLFDARDSKFKLQLPSSNVTLDIIHGDGFKYYVSVSSRDSSKPITFDTIINKSMNPTFNYDYLSFIFNLNVMRDNVLCPFSWLVKFSTFNELLVFQNHFMRALWESVNQALWNKVTESEQQYVVDAFSNVNLDDESEFETAESDDEFEDAAEDEDIDNRIERTLRGPSTEKKLFVDSDDEFGDKDGDKSYAEFRNQKKANRELAVGKANDRTFVARGNTLGVFTNRDKLQFETTINGLETLDGKTLEAKNMMLHQQDQNMILSGAGDKLYKMDLNRGKVIEEWNVSDKEPIVTYGPNSKFSQLTNEQTFTGISANGMFRVDPRLSGSKLVKDNHKVYKTTNNKFLSFTTTEDGYMAVASANGDIRLYDKLGGNAKSKLPSLGDPIIGIDTSKDGRWILATCSNYLLLIDAMVGRGQMNANSLGYVKYFDQDKKPVPRRLAIKPEDEAFMSMETKGKPVQFTKAYFNTGKDTKETTIVTSSGPYVFTWSLSKVLRTKKDNQVYRVKRYPNPVVADNFKFGSNTDVIIALDNEVSMIKKSKLSKADKDSLTDPNNVVKSEW